MKQINARLFGFSVKIDHALPGRALHGLFCERLRVSVAWWLGLLAFHAKTKESKKQLQKGKWEPSIKREQRGGYGKKNRIVHQSTVDIQP